MYVYIEVKLTSNLEAGFGSRDYILCICLKGWSARTDLLYYVCRCIQFWTDFSFHNCLLRKRDAMEMSK